MKTTNSALRLLDIFQQYFTLWLNKREQHTDLNISNNTNRFDRKKQYYMCVYIYIYI